MDVDVHQSVQGIRHQNDAEKHMYLRIGLAQLWNGEWMWLDVCEQEHTSRE